MPRSDRRPWSAFYWSDWLDDPGVQAMTFDEQGRYVRVLALTNRSATPGFMTEDQIRSWACYSRDEWPEHREAFAGCHEVRGDRWVQRRTVRESKRSEAIGDALSDRGKKGAAARWEKTREVDASATEGQMQQASSKHRKTPNFDARAMACPTDPHTTDHRPTSTKASGSRDSESAPLRLSAGAGTANGAVSQSRPRKSGNYDSVAVEAWVTASFKLEPDRAQYRDLGRWLWDTGDREMRLVLGLLEACRTAAPRAPKAYLFPGGETRVRIVQQLNARLGEAEHRALEGETARQRTKRLRELRDQADRLRDAQP